MEHGVKDLLENFLGIESGDSTSDTKSADGCTVAVLLMLNALILHGRLEKTSGQVARLIGENTLREIAAAEDPCDVLAETWMSVLEYDYRPRLPASPQRGETPRKERTSNGCMACDSSASGLG